jgi:hypothetical protein
MTSRHRHSTKREGEAEPGASHTKRPKAEDDDRAAGAAADSLAAHPGGEAAVVTASPTKGEEDNSDGPAAEGQEGNNEREGAVGTAALPHGGVAAGIERLRKDAAGNVVVTLATGYKGALNKVGEDDPALLIMWEDANVRQTVAAFNAAVLAAANAGGAAGAASVPVPAGTAAVPDWMALQVGQYTEDILKHKILTHIKQKAGPGAGDVIGNAVIAPNDFHGYVAMIQELYGVGTEPFFMAHAVCPIGRIYCLADKKHKTTAVHDPVHIPPYGVGVFQ